MALYQSTQEMIGNTPLVKLNRFDLPEGVHLYAKLELANPSGSVKDRIGKYMLEKAERLGLIRPGGTIVEPTSGNTGVGLALVAQQRGYNAVFVVPEKVNEAKRAVLRSYGASVVVAPNVEPDDPRSYYNISDRLAEVIPGGYKPNQYFNVNGPESHYRTTGPEIWRDTDGKVTHFVAGMGTCGTMMGVSKYLKEVSNGAVRAIGADPDGSIYSNPSDVHGYKVEGVGEDFYPGIYDPSLVDGFYHVSDLESFAMARRLSREEGLLVGGSSGMAVVGALKMAKAEKLTKDDLVVVLLPDSGRSYMSTIFNDQWLKDNGFGKILEDEAAARGDSTAQQTIDDAIASVQADANAKAAAQGR